MVDIKHKHTHITPFNGAYYTKDGEIHNLDGTIGDAANGTNMTPFCGVYYDSNGDPQDITDLLNGGGGGSGGVSMGQVNAAVLVETNNRIAADNLLRTDINQNTTNITTLRTDLTTETAARIAADTAEVTARNAAISVETTARIAADNAEVTARNNAISTAITTEVTNRNNAIATAITNYDNFKIAVQLPSGTLTRVINGTTNIAKSLFPNIAQIKMGKCIINDSTGTIGSYESDANAATMIIRTLTIDTIGGSGASGPKFLGNVANYASLPTTVTGATTLFKMTPAVDDYAKVLVDETQNGNLVEYYVLTVDATNDIITWGNSTIINTSNYQAQTATTDNGLVLTGGATAGTFGPSIGFDTTPIASSTNLVRSGDLYTIMPTIQNATFTGDGTNNVFTTTISKLSHFLVQVYDKDWKLVICDIQQIQGATTTDIVISLEDPLTAAENLYVISIG